MKYRTLEDRFDYPAGTIVYKFYKHDYGCARDDSYSTQKEHISVTEDPAGDYPFFTIAREQLEKIND